MGHPMLGRPLPLCNFVDYVSFFLDRIERADKIVDMIQPQTF